MAATPGTISVRAFGRAQSYGRLLPVLFLAMAIAGGNELGRGVYIKSKALLAQHLLESAWQETLATGQSIKAWSWADTWPVARLRISRLQIDLLVLNGVSGEALAFGPGQMEGLARPGEKGVALIAGHRDTHFSFLKNLKPGDQIEIDTMDGGRATYVMRAAEIVDSRITKIRNDRSTSSLILSTCYPFDALIPGGPLRYLVYAEKI